MADTDGVVYGFARARNCPVRPTVLRSRFTGHRTSTSLFTIYGRKLINDRISCGLSKYRQLNDCGGGGGIFLHTFYNLVRQSWWEDEGRQ